MTSEDILSNGIDEFIASANFSNSVFHTTIESGHNICNASEKLEPYSGLELEKMRSIRTRTCSNCGTSSTSTWRNLGDQIVCNACKCFYRKHGKSRPIHMRKDTIITRNRKVCKLSVPNEAVFTVKDEPNQNSLELDSDAVAEVMCFMIQYFKNS